jgi:hypothetical protein
MITVSNQLTAYLKKNFSIKLLLKGVSLQKVLSNFKHSLKKTIKHHGLMM